MKTDLKRVRLSIVIPLIITIILWIIEIVLIEFNINYHNLGILPRNIYGSHGILLSPFIHGDYKHLIANTPSFLILSWALYYFYKEIANSVLFSMFLLSGILTWLLGRDSYHIGISGVIYALAFYIFFSGVFRKNARLSALALIIVFIYGSLFWSLLPVTEYIDPKISWEGHLSGAIAGFTGAIYFRHKGPADEVSCIDDDIEEDNIDENEVFDNQEKDNVKLS